MLSYRQRKIYRELRYLCCRSIVYRRFRTICSVPQRSSIGCRDGNIYGFSVFAALGRDFRCAENGKRISGSAFLIRGICLRCCRNRSSTRAASQGNNALARHGGDRRVAGRIRFDGYAVGVVKRRLRSKRAVGGNDKRRGRIRNIRVFVAGGLCGAAGGYIMIEVDITLTACL